jgi:hypothetical protein
MPFVISASGGFMNVVKLNAGIIKLTIDNFLENNIFIISSSKKELS